MPYSNRIRTLEESLRLVETQINVVQNSDSVDQNKLNNLQQAKNKYLTELRELRRAQYESTQIVDFGDE